MNRYKHASILDSLMKKPPIHVLIVDDDYEDFLIVSDLLMEIQSQRYELDLISDYEPALAQMVENSHDVYLVDYRLGEHSGLDLIHDAIEGGCAKPMIILTGHGDRTIDVEAMHEGAADYLEKGRIDAQLLERTIRYAISHKQSENMLASQAAELARSNQELANFTGAVSHDLKAPLINFSGCLTLLKEQVENRLHRDDKELLDKAIDQAYWMNDMINNLLDYSQVSHNETHFKKADLNKVLGRALENLQSRIQDTNALVTRNPLPTLPVNNILISRVFQNLVGNALKFCNGKQPEIFIGSKRNGNFWMFWIQDNGIGIPDKDVDKIFQLFKRAPSHKNYEGTGMGLAMCKKIIELHGGRIWVKSIPGNGATFFFTLPEIIIS